MKTNKSYYFSIIKSFANPTIITALESQAVKIYQNGKYKSIHSITPNMLANISADIISAIGTYLTKQESINLGYTNRTFYITTQQVSFINNRISIYKDPPVVISNRLINELSECADKCQHYCNYNQYNRNTGNSKVHRCNLWLKYGLAYRFPSAVAQTWNRTKFKHDWGHNFISLRDVEKILQKQCTKAIFISLFGFNYNYIKRSQQNVHVQKHISNSNAASTSIDTYTTRVPSIGYTFHCDVLKLMYTQFPRSSLHGRLCYYPSTYCLECFVNGDNYKKHLMPEKKLHEKYFGFAINLAPTTLGFVNKLADNGQPLRYLNSVLFAEYNMDGTVKQSEFVDIINMIPTVNRIEIDAIINDGWDLSRLDTYVATNKLFVLLFKLWKGDISRCLLKNRSKIESILIKVKFEMYNKKQYQGLIKNYCKLDDSKCATSMFIHDFIPKTPLPGFESVDGDGLEHIVRTKSDLKWKSIGTLFYNMRQWIGKRFIHDQTAAKEFVLFTLGVDIQIIP